MIKLNLQRPLAFIDLETTGVNLAEDRIVEISIHKALVDGRTETKTLRVNPGIPIPKEASMVHGIYDEDVKDKPKFAQIAEEIKQYLDNCDLAGYNSNRFDFPLLIEEFLRAGVDFDSDNRKYVDVQRIFHLMEKRTLGAAYQFYCNKELTNAHSAEADTIATYEVLLGQLEKYNSELQNSVDFLHDFTNDGDFVDFGRRLFKKNGKIYFAFGKNKDREVKEILKKEPQYYDWIMKSDFMLDTKRKLEKIKKELDKEKF